MGRFRNLETGVVVSVDDSKDERFASGFESEATSKKAPAKSAEKSASKPEK